MKKISFSLLLLTFVFFTSCEKEDVTQVKSYDFVINQSDFFGSNGTYYAEVPVKVSEDDLINIYSYEGGDYVALPYTVDDYVVIGYVINGENLYISLVYYNGTDSPTSEAVGSTPIKVVIAK